MKKLIAISALAATVITVNAADKSYRIYLGAFSDSTSQATLDKLSSNIKNELKGSKIAEVSSYPSGSNKILYLDTEAMPQAEAQEILDRVKSINSSTKTAFMRPKKSYIATAETVTEANPVVTVSNDDESVVATEEKAQASVANLPALDEKPVVPSDDEAEGAPTLTLSEVVKQTLDTNPSLKSMEFNYLQVGKDLHISKNAYYPTLDLIITGGYSKQRKKENDGPRLKDGGLTSDVQLVLTQNLYNGGADENRINSQSARMDSAAYSVAQTADRLTLSLVNAYLEVIKTKRIVDVERESVKSHELIYNQIKDRAEAGFGVASEERQAGSRFTLAQSNLIAAQNNYEDALSTFEKLYGQKIEASSLVIPSFEVILPTSQEEVYSKAMQCNPSILVQRANIAMVESVVKEKNAAFLPKVDLELSGTYETSKVFYDHYDNEALNALVKLRYNLYNKGADKLDKEKSQLAAHQEQRTLDQLVRELSESLKFSWQSYVLEQKKMEYLNEHIDYARATLDSYQDEFRIGRRDLINLLDAENEYNTALKEIVNTETALLYAKYRLLDNMGMISDSFEPGFAKRYIQGACSIKNDLR